VSSGESSSSMGTRSYACSDRRTAAPGKAATGCLAAEPAAAELECQEGSDTRRRGRAASAQPCQQAPGICLPAG
jgi:hypothetical protein